MLAPDGWNEGASRRLRSLRSVRRRSRWIAAAAASAAVSAPDRQATFAYLQAESVRVPDALARASSPASASRRVEAECRDLLTGCAETSISSRPRRGEADLRVYQRQARARLRRRVRCASRRARRRERPSRRRRAAALERRRASPRRSPPIWTCCLPDRCAGPRRRAPISAARRSRFRRLAPAREGNLAAANRTNRALRRPSMETILRPLEAQPSGARRADRPGRSRRDPTGAERWTIDVEARKLVGSRLPKSLREPRLTTLRARAIAALEPRLPVRRHAGAVRPPAACGSRGAPAARRAARPCRSRARPPGPLREPHAVTHNARDSNVKTAASRYAIKRLDPRARTVRLARSPTGDTLSTRAIVLRPTRGAPRSSTCRLLGRRSSRPSSLTGSTLAGTIYRGPPTCPCTLGCPQAAA